MTLIDAVPLPQAQPLVPTIVRLSSEIGIITTADLRNRLLRALDRSTGRLVLDLSQVISCDPARLGVLADVRRRARARGITLTLTGLTPSMIQLLRL